MGGGLPRPGVGQPLLAEQLADGDEQILDLGQLGPPGRAVGAEELVDQVFGDALDGGADFFYLCGALLGSPHPWLLSELGSKQ